MRPNDGMKLIFWIALFEGIGFLLGLMTQSNIDPWYKTLNHSQLTPPDYIFSVAWTLLYALLAVIAWILSSHSPGAPKSLKMLFGMQMLMNWAWTPLFFQLHWLTFSAIWLVALTLLNVIFISKAKSSQPTLALLLIPYTLWLLFAAYLNVVVAFMN